MRGLGRVFKRGPVYWVAYYHRGKEYRESSESENESAAKKLLKKRIGEVAQGRLRGANQDRLTFDDLAQALLADYQLNGRRSLRSARLSISQLRKFFGFDRAVDITTGRIQADAADRQKAEAANASI